MYVCTYRSIDRKHGKTKQKKEKKNGEANCSLADKLPLLSLPRDTPAGDRAGTMDNSGQISALGNEGRRQ